MLPGLIYKYCPLNLNSLRVLIDNKLYLGPPINFNDPFEGDFEFKKANKLPDKDILVKLFGKPRVDLSLYSLADYNEITEFYLRNLIKNKYGVSCFSTINNNPLMWGHYSDSRKGICLEFDTTKLISSFDKLYSNQNVKLEKVRYTKKLLKLEAKLKGNNILYGKDRYNFLSIKQRHWSYEKEYRLIVNIDDDNYSRYFHLENDCITKIIIGDRMDQDDQRMLDKLIKNSNHLSHVKTAYIKIDSNYKEILITDNPRIYFDVQPKVFYSH